MMARLPRWLWVAGGVAILIGALALVIFLRGGFQTPQPAKLSLNSTNPQALLQEADYLAYLGNWEKACPYFAKAQRLFSAQGDQRDALYCRISCVEADVEKGSYTAAASYLSQELHDSLVRLMPSGIGPKPWPWRSPSMMRSGKLEPRGGSELWTS
jgi:hypothetical protein